MKTLTILLSTSNTSSISVSSTETIHTSLLLCSNKHYTVWRVIFRGANFREMSKVAIRINFRGYNFRDGWRPSSAVRAWAYAVLSTLCGARVVCTLPQPCACFWRSIELAAIPTSFAELLRKLWTDFLSTLVCEAIMSTMIYGRLVSVRSCRVNARTDMLLIHMICWYDRERHQLVNSSDEETSAQFLSIFISLYLAPLTWLLYDRVSRSAGASVMQSTTPTARDCACVWYVSLIFCGGNFHDC